jgi:hypothetical protein
MRLTKTSLFIACISLLSACATVADTGKTKSSIETSRVQFSPIAHARTVELLNFIANYSDLSTEAQKTIFQDNIKALANNKTDTKRRIKHSAMLALPNSALKDLPAAKRQLQSLLDSHELNESETNLIKLLLSYTQESSEQLTSVQDLTKKNDLLKQKNKSLTQKLNDLKNIEKTMIKRNSKTNNNL